MEEPGREKVEGDSITQRLTTANDDLTTNNDPMTTNDLTTNVNQQPDNG